MDEARNINRREEFKKSELYIYISKSCNNYSSVQAARTKS